MMIIVWNLLELTFSMLYLSIASCAAIAVRWIHHVENSDCLPTSIASACMSSLWNYALDLPHTIGTCRAYHVHTLHLCFDELALILYAEYIDLPSSFSLTSFGASPSLTADILLMFSWGWKCCFVIALFPSMDAERALSERDTELVVRKIVYLYDALGLSFVKCFVGWISGDVYFLFSKHTQQT